MKPQIVYKTFEEFYPFYLSQHANHINRRLHIIGTLLALIICLYAIMTFQPFKILYGVVIGYGFAWVGHFFFEMNKPATFKYPLFSFKGDLRMLKETLAGERKF